MANRIRERKTTKVQYEILVSYTEQNPLLFNNKLMPNFTAHHRDEHWKNLTCMLNAEGPEKSAEKWKKVSMKLPLLHLCLLLIGHTYMFCTNYLTSGVDRLEV